MNADHRYTINLPPAEGCPTRHAWEKFWSTPPTSLDDERLSEYLAWEAEWTEPLDFDEDTCAHCRAEVGRVRALIADLGAAPEEVDR